MSRKPLTIGYGMTTREAISLDDLSREDAQAIGEAFRDATQEAWRQGGGTSFGTTTADQVTVCTAILDRAGPGKYPVDSPPYFARWYLHLHSAAQKHIRDGHADLAALTAWEAGTVFARADTKWQWEKFALSGRRVAERLNDESTKANRRRHRQAQANWQVWAREADRVQAERPDLKSQSRVAECVVARLKLAEKPDTVARAIKKVRTAL